MNFELPFMFNGTFSVYKLESFEKAGELYPICWLFGVKADPVAHEAP